MCSVNRSQNVLLSGQLFFAFPLDRCTLVMLAYSDSGIHIRRIRLPCLFALTLEKGVGLCHSRHVCKNLGQCGVCIGDRCSTADAEWHLGMHEGMRG